LFGLLTSVLKTIDSLIELIQNYQELKVESQPQPQPQTDMNIHDVLSEIPIIDLTCLITAETDNDNDNANDNSQQQLQLQTSKQIINSFHKYGIVICRDPRVPFENNKQFLDMLEIYFSRTDEQKVSYTN
jgi:hypothetical protein